ncbi:MAG: RIP metalloprotease RseP [Candidatus Scatovivens sp.]
MNFILGAIKIVFVLGFLIFIHEGGHFLVAIACKVKVKEFSIGFGPKLFSKTIKDTKYSLRLIPFGGFVDMLGESERKNEEGSFSNSKVWKRILIVAAGAIVNIVFGLIVYFSLVSIYGNNISTQIENILPEYSENLNGLEKNDEIISIDGKKVHLKSDINLILNDLCKDEVIITVKRENKKIDVKVKTSKEQKNKIGVFFESNDNIVDYVEPKSPAYNIGIKQGDKILKINNIPTEFATEIIKNISQSDNIKIEINRDGKILNFDVETLKECYYYLGIINKKAENTLRQNIYYAYWETSKFVFDIFDNLKNLFTGNVYIEQLSGPIGISEYIVKTDTIYNFVYLISLISLSLGITNLLPIPALDGGKIFLLIIEWIRGKPINEELEIKIQTFGFLLLICLSIYISYNDIIRLF